MRPSPQDCPEGPTERRTEPRLPVDHLVKLRGENTGLRYHTARTRNVSPGGALLQLDGPTALRPGERVQLGFADHARTAVLPAAQMIEAVILRSLGHRNQQEIAVRFTMPQALPLAS